MRDAIARELAENILPLIRADGGELELLDVTEGGVVRIRLSAACVGCPGSTFTISMVIEERLRRAVPGFTRVETSFGYGTKQK